MQPIRVAVVVLSLAFTALTSGAQEQTNLVRSNSSVRRQPKIQSHYGSLPLMFEANQGQADGRVKYMSHGDGYSVYLTAGGAILSLQTRQTMASPELVDGMFPRHGRPPVFPIHQREKTLQSRKNLVLGIDLVGATPNPRVSGEAPLPTKVNYFIGRDPKRWRRNVQTYSRVRYSNIYPGIDLIYYGKNHKIEYDFDVAPGADPGKIEFSVKGADNLTIDPVGNLVLEKAGAKLVFQFPVLYQQSGGVRTKISGAYLLRDATHVAFRVGTYDTTKRLVIDPVLVYSTFLGGSNDDFAMGVAVDSVGGAYVTGITDSPDFPLANLGTYSPTQFRMFVAGLDPSGSSLLFADYFGGTAGDDPYAIALDPSGNVYVAGSTTSQDFPLLAPYQVTFSGSEDAFLSKFASDGSLVYSTYLGGSNLNSIGGATSQVATSLAVDPAGEPIVAGFTQATDFPIVNGSQSTVAADQFGNWGQYGFVTKFASDGASLVYSTYLGGSTYNTSSCVGCFPVSLILGVATDSTGNAYLTGFTNTVDYPVTTGAFMTSSPADPMADVGIITKLSGSGALAYSTYLGGYSNSVLNAIAVDTTGSAYVTGYDSAGDGFPIVTTSICDPATSNCNGTVIAKLDPTGSSLAYSTFLGTSNNMMGQAIQVDAAGNAFIMGSDLQFDLSNPIEQYAGSGDIVIAEVDSSASTLLMATFLGGHGLDFAGGLALDSTGALYAVGSTESVDFPDSPTALQTLFGGSSDAFIAKIDPATNGSFVAVSPASIQFASQAVGTTSTAQTSVLRNMGSAPLTINSKNIMGDFAESDDCGTSVSPASFCTFTITFTPTGPGTRNGTLSVSDDATGSPHTVAIIGVGTLGPQGPRISPTTLNFAPAMVGTTSATQSVTFNNEGGQPVVVGDVRVTGDFAIAGNSCSTVPPSGSCTVQVIFLPSASGPRAGTLEFHDSINTGPQVVALSGSGIDFVPTIPDSSATVTAGESANYSLNVTPSGGTFVNPITFTCEGAPEFTTCNVNPQSVTPGNNISVVSVTVATSGPTSHALGIPRIGMFSNKLVALVLFGVFLVGIRNPRSRRAQIVASTVVMLLILSACAGGTGRLPIDPRITPKGTYTLNVIAASGRLQHSTSLTLIVK